MMKSFRFLFAIIAVLLGISLTFPEAAEKTNKIVEEKSPVSQMTKKLRKDIQCLAENIYHEARGEPLEGKFAVVQVVMNRTEADGFPADVCGVINQKVNGTCQFSWKCSKMKNGPKNEYEWEESVYVAEKVLVENKVAHPLLKKTNVLYYHANYVNPRWKLQRVSKIGNHIFYKEKNGTKV